MTSLVDLCACLLHRAAWFVQNHRLKVFILHHSAFHVLPSAEISRWEKGDEKVEDRAVRSVGAASFLSRSAVAIAPRLFAQEQPFLVFSFFFLFLLFLLFPLLTNKSRRKCFFKASHHINRCDRANGSSEFKRVENEHLHTGFLFPPQLEEDCVLQGLT